jgi:hypothetical protein
MPDPTTTARAARRRSEACMARWERPYLINGGAAARHAARRQNRTTRAAWRAYLRALR